MGKGTESVGRDAGVPSACAQSAHGEVQIISGGKIKNRVMPSGHEKGTSEEDKAEGGCGHPATQTTKQKPQTSI